MQKWQIELHHSPLWLLETFIWVTVLSVLAVYLLSKTKVGKQFWVVLRPCLKETPSYRIILLLSLLLLLLLTEIRLNVLNTFFYNGLYSALQDVNAQLFWFFALVNAAVVILRTLNGVFNDLLDSSLAIKWSQKLNHALVEHWLSHKRYYQLQLKQTDRIDNIDQRIQQDAQDFINSTITFVRGMVDSIISALEFTIVLWGLSGILTILGVDIPKGIVFFVFIFVALSTGLAIKIGKPLVRYHYDNEKLNGNYRYSLVRIRENAESVAFYHGEPQESERLHHQFAKIIKNRWKIAFQTVSLNGVNTMLTQAVQLLPLMLQAPRFFMGQIKIGDMHQTVQAFNRLQRALSFFRNFYEQFTSYQARLERLYDFMQTTSEKQVSQATLNEVPMTGLSLQNVHVYHANGQCLLHDLNLTLKAGEALLIRGLSGSGKTSLLRVLAGLWPFDCQGQITRTQIDQVMFVPQHAYMPQARLKEAILYPCLNASDEHLHHALKACRLEHLIDQLDQEADWQQRLSPGELQRVAFVRIFLAKPQLVLLDEATSALDEYTERLLYQQLRQVLPQSIIVSVGHRSSLHPFHDRYLNLSGS